MADDFTVFVVDDNAGIRQSMQNLCRAEKLAVETYASADEFLAAYNPSSRGCLLLDIRLGGSNGLDLQDKLRRRKSTLPIIVMTAYANVPTSIRAFKSGAVDFLQKPVSPTALLKRIRHLIKVDRQARHAAAPRDDVQRRIASLTPRERQVMNGLVDGLISKEIAFALGLTTRTVEWYRREVLRKMGVTSAAQLVRVVLSGNDSRVGGATSKSNRRS